MNRRNFLKISALLAYAGPLWAGNIRTLNIGMKGDLDDDLFIVKTKGLQSKMLECMQMHNPKKEFIYDGKVVESKPIYGMIDFVDKYTLGSNEIYSFFVANEREEIFDHPKLNMRSHFRAVDLYANGDVLIPQLLPEDNDVPNYPTWFGSEDEYCRIDGVKTVEYNYYKLWENAICGAGIVISRSADVEIKLFSSEHKLLFTASQKVTNKSEQVKFFDVVKNKPFTKHLLAEVDGEVYKNEGKQPNDKYVKQYSIARAIVNIGKEKHIVIFPYPFPYPNRLYIKSIS